MTLSVQTVLVGHQRLAHVFVETGRLGCWWWHVLRVVNVLTFLGSRLLCDDIEAVANLGAMTEVAQQRRLDARADAHQAECWLVLRRRLGAVAGAKPEAAWRRRVRHVFHVRPCFHGNSCSLQMVCSSPVTFSTGSSNYNCVVT